MSSGEPTDGTPEMPTVDTRSMPLPVFAFAIAQFVVLGVVPRGVSVGPGSVPLALSFVAVVEVVLIGELGLSLVRTATPGRAVVGYFVSAGVLTGLAVSAWRLGDAVWIGTVVLLLAVAAGLYGVHRYERVALGLAGGEGA